jgi:integrase/recombinase XerD
MTNLTQYIDAEIIEDTSNNFISSQQHNNINQFRNLLFGVTPTNYESAIGQWLRQFTSKATQKQYSKAITTFKSWYPVQLAEVTPAIFQNYIGFITWIYKNKNTQAIKVTAIKSFFKFCLNNRYIAFNPCGARAPKKSNAVHERIVKDSQLNKVLAIADKFPPTFSLLIEFLAATGCRISEALNAVYINSNGSENYRVMKDGDIALRVVGKGNKSREVRVPASLWGRIFKLSNGKKYLFNGEKSMTKLNYSTAYNWLKKALKLIGINGKISFHWLRHYAAKKGLSSGNDIKVVARSLGHANINTTAIYLDLNDDDIMKF